MNLKFPETKSNKGVALLSFLTVVCQLFIGTKSDDRMDLEFSRIRSELVNIHTNQETYFAKKEEVKEISSKIDRLGIQVADLRNHLKKDHEAAFSYFNLFRKDNSNVSFSLYEPQKKQIQSRKVHF